MIELTLERWHQCLASFLSDATGLPAEKFGLDANLIEERLIDSLTFMKLYAHVETLLDREIAADGFRVEEFDTIRKIYLYHVLRRERTAAVSAGPATGAVSLPPIEVRTFRSFDGTHVRCLELGRGVPLVVSSPLGLPLEFWAPLFARLHERHCIVFVQRRGLWGSEIPAQPEHLSVDAHARDLALVIDRLPDRFCATGFCSGVQPLVRALSYTARRPDRTCLMSGRFCVGDELEGRRLYARVAGRPERTRRLIEMIAAFAPEDLRAAYMAELAKPGQLEAQLTAVEYSRRYDGSHSLPRGLNVTFVYGEHDEELSKESTVAYVQRAQEPGWKVVELKDAGHFYIADRVDQTATLLREALDCAGAA